MAGYNVVPREFRDRFQTPEVEMPTLYVLKLGQKMVLFAQIGWAQGDGVLVVGEACGVDVGLVYCGWFVPVLWW